MKLPHLNMMTFQMNEAACCHKLKAGINIILPFIDFIDGNIITDFPILQK